MVGLEIVVPETPGQIIHAYWCYLISLGEFYEVFPTEENARFLAESNLIPAWERGEPILFAAIGNTIIGATFTTLPPAALELRHRFAFGHGTWVADEYRGRGVARALIEEVRRRLRALGVTRQIGQADVANEASRKTFEKLGFLPYAVVLSYDL